MGAGIISIWGAFNLLVFKVTLESLGAVPPTVTILSQPNVLRMFPVTGITKVT